MLQHMDEPQALKGHPSGEIILSQDELGFLLTCTAKRCPFVYRPVHLFEAQRRADFHADSHQWDDYDLPENIHEDRILWD